MLPGHVLVTALSCLLLTLGTDALFNGFLKSIHDLKKLQPFNIPAVLTDSTAKGTATDITAFSQSPVEIAKQYGYEAETHTVTTPDGYILSLHRIRNGFVRSPKEPFMLVPGFACNSAIWNVLEPSQNLAFILADNGCDVWLANFRGTVFSRKHEKLSPESGEFWNYGWHEHGTIDMPAIIDYILAQTSQSQLYYAGHSMGNTMFFVMASMRPEYNAKIKHMFALGPVAFCGNMKTPAKALFLNSRLYQNLLKATNNHVPYDVLVFQIAKMEVCAAMKTVCPEFFDIVGGNNPKSNRTLQRALFQYYPDAISAKQYAHYAQLFNNPNEFRLFDHYEENRLVYGATTPPNYPVEKISAPMTFFYASNDFIADPKDVELFSRKLRNVKLFLVEDQQFSHFDFIISSEAKELVYTPIVNIVNSYRITRN